MDATTNENLRVRVDRLAAAFESEFSPSAALDMLRSADHESITLPDHPAFGALASEAGDLLAEAPEHWRFGVQARSLAEADPAKRWVRAVFDWAIAGMVDVPNWDAELGEEHIDQAARASAVACKVLLLNARRPNWGNGTYAAAEEFARAQADDLVTGVQQHADPGAASVYLLAATALDAACKIVFQSRSEAASPPAAFVRQQLLLTECVKRLEEPDRAPAMRRWPTTPGTTFSTKAGDSALDAAVQFCNAIKGATLYARTQTLGILGHEPSSLRLEPDPDPNITSWCAATIKELREHTLPPPPAWPVWEIRRDRERLDSLMRAELRRCVASAPTGAPAPPEPFVFRCSGTMWHMRFGPKDVELAYTPLRGFQIIAMLLSRPHPDRPFPATAFLDPKKRAAGHSGNGPVPEAEPSRASGDPISDGFGFKKIKEKLEQLAEDRAFAMGEGNAQRLSEIDAETAEISMHVTQIKRAGNRDHGLSGDTAERRASDAARKALTAALRVIRGRQAALAEHLDKSIVVHDYTYAYRPGVPVSWAT